MTRTQTALYTWTAPDGTPRHLIDPAEWQDGQKWSRSDLQRPGSAYPPMDEYGPVWVGELLPIPEPLPERSPEPMPNLRWVDMPVALLHQLPVGSLYRTRFDGNTYRKTGSQRTKCDVFVVAWGDGTKPERPTVDDDLPPDDLDYKAWVLLANVSEGDWTKQTPEWREAALRWREAFHESLDGRNMVPPTVDGAR